MNGYVSDVAVVEIEQRRVDVIGSVERWALQRPAVVLGVGFVAVSLIANWQQFTTGLTEDGDYAADSIRTRDAWTQTTGIYSRWGFHHPGPVLFWMKAVGNTIGRIVPGLSMFGGQMLMQATLVACAVGVLVSVISTPANRWLLASVGFGLAALFSGGAQYQLWAPTTATWFVLLGIGAVAGIAGQRRWAFPVAVLAAMACIHLHVTMVPPGVTLLAAAVGMRWWRRRQLGRTDLLIGAGVFTVMVAPLLVALAAGDSSWGAYLRSDDPGMTARRPWRVALSVLIETAGPFDLLPYRSWTTVLVLGGGLAVLPALGAMWAISRRRSASITVAAVGALGWFVYLIAISRFTFLDESIGGSVLLVALVLPTLAAVKLPAIDVRLWVGLGAVVMLTAIAVPELGGQAPTASGVAERALADAGRGPVAVDYEDNAFSEATAFTLLALREGVDVCVVERRWPYWMPEDLLCTTDDGRPVITFG